MEKGDDYDDSLSSMRGTARMEEGYRRNLLRMPELSEVRCSSSQLEAAEMSRRERCLRPELFLDASLGIGPGATPKIRPVLSSAQLGSLPLLN